MMFKKASLKKGKTGMRYEAEYMLECLLLHIRSPTAYEHLKTNQMLPLPDPDHVRRLIGALACKFGFHDFAVKAIAAHLKGKKCFGMIVLIKKNSGVLNYFLSIGSLILDEISITPDLYFNAQSLQMEGITNHAVYEDGDAQANTQINNEELKFADHALVLMYRPFDDDWVQTITVFSAKNAMPGDTLKNIVREAIVLLENIGAQVMSIVCDGAQTNKSMWQQFGVLGKNDESFRHFMDNPMAPERKIYFIWDPPHVIKCIRNNFINHRIIQVFLFYFFYSSDER